MAMVFIGSTESWLGEINLDGIYLQQRVNPRIFLTLGPRLELMCGRILFLESGFEDAKVTSWSPPFVVVPNPSTNASTHSAHLSQSLGHGIRASKSLNRKATSSRLGNDT